MVAWVLEITDGFQIIFAMEVQNNYPKFVGPCFMKGYGENWSRKHIKKKNNPWQFEAKTAMKGSSPCPFFFPSILKDNSLELLIFRSL